MYVMVYAPTDISIILSGFVFKLCAHLVIVVVLVYEIVYRKNSGKRSKLEEASTHKSATTHAVTIFVTREVSL